MRILLILVFGLMVGLSAVVVRAEPGKTPPMSPPEKTEAKPQADVAAALDVNDVAEPFVPARPRTEAESDRIEALSLFSAGRVAEQEDHLFDALRRYERASRFDPASQTARRHAVVLAIRLDRWQEALRYAAQGELGIDEAGVLWELARHFAADEQFAEALNYYRAARALQPEKKSTGYIILSLDVGRMAYLTHSYAEAADAFSEVSEALEHPDQFGLDERLYKRLVAGKEGATGLAQLYLLFAEAFASAERFDQAAAALEKANRITPNAAVFAYRKARLEDARKAPARALELLWQYLDAKETSEGLAPYQLLAKLLADLGRGAETTAMLEKLHADDSDNSFVTLTLAEQCRADKDFSKAELLYRLVLDKDPSAAAGQGLAASLRHLKRSGDLLNLLAEVAGRTGQLETLGDELKAIASDKELTEAVIKVAREKHQADADNLGVEARRAVAMLALEAGRFDDAAEFFERAIKVNREGARELYRTWGVGLMRNERYDEAAAVLRRAIDERAVAADDPTLHYYLSGALVMGDKPAEALEVAEHAASLNPRSPLIAGRVAWILYHAKRYEEAAAAYRDLVRRFDEGDISELGRQEVHNARMALSNVAVIQHDASTAEEYLSQVLDEFPDDVGAQNDLGYLWADESKHLMRSLAMIERAVAAEPDNVAFRDSLGWIYHRLGRHEEAVAELKKAVAGDAPDGVMWEHLGDVSMAAGQSDGARDAWRRAVTAFEKDGDADKIARVKKKLDGSGG
ncbi:MAG TPA: tetratricopeptide repeat protein [Pirellulales bacterium]|nr:tetratricopeptide repeat protein [Pirellulales bacterium]